MSGSALGGEDIVRTSVKAGECGRNAHTLQSQVTNERS